MIALKAAPANPAPIAHAVNHAPAIVHPVAHAVHHAPEAVHAGHAGVWPFFVWYSALYENMAAHFKTLYCKMAFFVE